MTEKKQVVTLVGLWVWFIAALFFLYEFFLRTFPGSLAKQIIPSLHLNPTTFSLISSGYYIAYAVMQVPVGILADKFGVKRIMFFAVLFCSASTLWFAASGGLGSAFMSRLLMGFGSSFAFVCLLVVAVTWLPQRYFGFFSGASQLIGTMGPLLAGGPLVALMLETHTSWRVTMTEVAFFGFGLALLILLFVRMKPRDGGEVLHLQLAEPLSKKLVKLFANRQAWFVAFYSGVVYVSIALLAAVWGTEYLMARGYSQELASSMISIAWFGYAIGCPLLGAVSDLSRRRRPVFIFSALLGFVCTALLLFSPIHSHWLYGFLFVGLGVAASGQNVGFAAIAEKVDLETRASALGLNNGVITLMGAVLPPLVGLMLSHAAAGQAHLTAVDYVKALWVMPVLYLVGLILSLFFIDETYCKPQKAAIRLNRMK